MVFFYLNTMNLSLLKKLLCIKDLQVIKEEIIGSNQVKIKRFQIKSLEKPNIDIEFLRTLNTAEFCKFIIYDNGKTYEAIDTSRTFSEKLVLSYLKDCSLNESQLILLVNYQDFLIRQLRKQSDENLLKTYKDLLKIFKDYEAYPICKLSKLLTQEIVD